MNLLCTSNFPFFSFSCTELTKNERRKNHITESRKSFFSFRLNYPLPVVLKNKTFRRPLIVNEHESELHFSEIVIYPRTCFPQQIFHCSSRSGKETSAENCAKKWSLFMVHFSLFAVTDNSFNVATTPCNIKIIRNLNLCCSFFFTCFLSALNKKKFDSVRNFPEPHQKSCCCFYVILSLPFSLSPTLRDALVRAKWRRENSSSKRDGKSVPLENGKMWISHLVQTQERKSTLARCREMKRNSIASVGKSFAHNFWRVDD